MESLKLPLRHTMELLHRRFQDAAAGPQALRGDAPTKRSGGRADRTGPLPPAPRGVAGEAPGPGFLERGVCERQAAREACDASRGSRTGPRSRRIGGGSGKTMDVSNSRNSLGKLQGA